MTPDRRGDLRVDIVINNYNYAEYVTQAVDSACAQSHPAVKVIVVDDGSTDDSLDRLRAYGDRIELVAKENGGQASALNAGAERCHGDVVMFLDADDALHPQAAARAAGVFAADSDVVKVQCRMEVIDGLGRSTGILKPAPHLPLPVGDVRDAELAFPFDLVWLPTSALAFRTDALRKILPIPEDDYRLCADWYLNHLSALLGRVASLNEVGAKYRLHGRNGYEPQGQTLDLNHVRETIGYAQATTRALSRLAGDLGYRPPAKILSHSDLAGRLVSLRLEPDRHPVPQDTVRGLVTDALRATPRREVAWPMKALYIGWFLLAATAPRRAVRRLAELFVFPERRRVLNRLLQRMHQAPPGAVSVDWDRVGRIVDAAPGLPDLRAHGLELLAARRWRSQGRKVPASLAEEEAASSWRYHAAPHVLERIRAACDGPILLIKGPAVAERYPEPTARPFVDIDLLVPDPPAVQAALLDAGFRLSADPADIPDGFHHLPPIELPSHPIRIEVHGGLKWLDLLGAPSFAELAEGAQTEAMGVAGVWAPAPAQHTLLLAGHLWAHDPLARLLRLLDVAVLTEAIDLAEVEALAEQWGIGRLWRSTAAVADSLFGGGTTEPWPLRTWARGLRNARELTVAELHLSRVLSPFAIYDRGARLRGVAAALGGFMRPQDGESWRRKIRRTAVQLARPSMRRSRHLEELKGPPSERGRS